MHPKRRETMSQQGSGLINRSSTQFPLTQIEPNVWEVPKDFQSGMKVPARIYADEDLLSKMRTDRTIQQCVNVAHLDGICKYAITMPDGHEGYGFPIGGVAATDYDEGLISPGGVGYDINCGVRLIRTNLTEEEVRPVLPKLVDTIFNFIPSGLGSRGQVKLSVTELDRAVTDGLDWAVDHGYAWPEDPKTIEEEGCMEAADPSKVSNSAKSRVAPQLRLRHPANDNSLVDRSVLEGIPTPSRFFRHEDRLRRRPQRSKSRIPFDRRGNKEGYCSPERCYPLISTWPPRYSSRIQRRRTARPDTRKHGHEQLGPNRHAKGDGTQFRDNSPWSRSIHEPIRCKAEVVRRRPQEESGKPGHRYSRCQHGGVGRGSSRRIQGCR